jgi:NAD(P)-dependent dehydrogenase (short-subunit alcohol dehydrogenase family)
MILAGAAAIVTGGGVRIGREIGRRLARAGVHVCVHYGSSERAAREAADEFRALGVRATCVAADLAEPAAAARGIFEHARRELGEIRILVNSAAIFEPGSLSHTTEDAWDRHLDINLKAPFFLMQAFARQLGEHSPGAAVNIVDWRGERPIPGHAAYTVSKSGLIALTKLLAQELGPRIRVNGVAPGAILPGPGQTPEQFARRADFNPLRRTGGPGDVAEAVHYLLASSFVTGEILHVTGGEELGPGES